MCTCNSFFDKFLSIDLCGFPLRSACYIIAVMTVFEVFSPIYMYRPLPSTVTMGSMFMFAVTLLQMIACVVLGACAFILILALLQDNVSLITPWLYAMFAYIIIKFVYVPTTFYVAPQSIGLYASTLCGCINVAVYFFFFLVVNSYRKSRPRPPLRPKVPKPPKVKPPPKEKPQKKAKGKGKGKNEAAVVVNETEKAGPARTAESDEDAESNVKADQKTAEQKGV